MSGLIMDIAIRHWLAQGRKNARGSLVKDEDKLSILDRQKRINTVR